MDLYQPKSGREFVEGYTGPYPYGTFQKPGVKDPKRTKPTPTIAQDPFAQPTKPAMEPEKK